METANSTQIYTVFSSAGHPVGFDAYRRHHPDVSIMDNQEILERVKNQSKDVEFVGKAEPVKLQEAISQIKQERRNLGGVLVFGAPPDELISIGLPTIAVARPLEGCTTVPFQAYKGSHVVTSFLPSHSDKDPEVYSRRFEDIARKVKLIDAISKMKLLRALVVTDKPVLGYFEPMNLQIETTREEYETVYLDNMEKTLGTEFVTVPQKELFDKVRAADERKAKELTAKWISEALGLRGTNEAQVLSSAKLYLAMKELMEENNCGAITTEGFGWPPLGFQKAVELGIPSQGIPTSQFLTDGIAAASETLTDCLITQQLGLYITGAGGLLGDYTIDPGNETAIVAHCEGSFTPYPNQGMAPYTIRNLPFVEENTGGACAEILYPIGKTVTVAKIGIYKKRLSLFTGKTVSGEELFPYWTDILGRNKVAIRTNAKGLLENVDWRSFGNHRTVFFGDHRQQFKDLATLLGYEAVEKDK